MARTKFLSNNLNAILDTIAFSEGTSTSSVTKDDGYDVIVSGVTGDETFIDYSTHPFAKGRPSKVINSKGLKSSAAGRYQFMLKDYAYYVNKLDLPDFGPESQDRWAIQLIKERKALTLIDQGKFEDVIALIRNLWASLPGAGYGQFEHSINDLKNIYLLKGGKLWDSKPSLQLDLQESLPQSLPTLKVEVKQTPIIQSKTELKKPAGLLNLIMRLFKRN